MSEFAHMKIYLFVVVLENLQHTLCVWAVVCCGLGGNESVCLRPFAGGIEQVASNILFG